VLLQLLAEVIGLEFQPLVLARETLRNLDLGRNDSPVSPMLSSSASGMTRTCPSWATSVST